MSAPRRFFEDHDAPQVMRAAVRGARADVPDAAHMNALGASIAAKIGTLPPGGGGSGGAPPAGGAGGIGAAKVATIAGTIGVVAIGATWIATQSSPTATSTATATATATATSTATATASATASASATPAIDVHALPGAASTAIARPSASAPSGPDEMTLLRTGQDALAGSPADALARADEAARRFPNGALAQEREVLAIDALLRLGRRTDAEARANRFRAAYPGSAYLRRLDTLLAR